MLTFYYTFRYHILLNSQNCNQHKNKWAKSFTLKNEKKKKTIYVILIK